MKSDSLDFPAAHSMDTEWYAIDRNGHVAILDSGEDGAVPVDSGDEIASDEILNRLCDAGIDLPPALSLADLLPRWTELNAGSPTDEIWIHAESPRPCAPQGLIGQSLKHGWQSTLGYHDCIFQLASGLSLKHLAPFLGNSNSHECFEMKLLDCTLIYRSTLSAEELSNLLAGGIAVRFWQGLPPATSIPGFFEYFHDSEMENWGSGPYKRILSPTQPIDCSSLRKSLICDLGFVDFGKVSFSESPLLQPMEHAPCRSWNSSWQASDSNTVRAVPGREEEYRTEILKHQHGHQERDGYRIIDPDEPE